MRYIPNPAHKLETTEAGPPRWRPSKEICPAMAPGERQALLDSSMSADPDEERGRRYAIRQTVAGFAFFEAKLTRLNGEVAEYHGHPTTRIPAKVLRRFRDRGDLTDAQYRRLVRDLS